MLVQVKPLNTTCRRPTTKPRISQCRLTAISPMANEAADTPPADAAEAAARQDRPRNRIQVSREKRPLNFFIGLAKKFLLSEDEVELSGLGLAVTTVVTVAEILKNSGHVTISSTWLPSSRRYLQNTALVRAPLRTCTRARPAFTNARYACANHCCVLTRCLLN